MQSGKDEETRWLALAAEAREIASEITDHTARAIMIKIAEGYENMARLAVKRRNSSA